MMDGVANEINETIDKDEWTAVRIAVRIAVRPFLAPKSFRPFFR